MQVANPLNFVKTRIVKKFQVVSTEEQKINVMRMAIKNSYTKYPKIEIVSVNNTDGTAAKAYQYATDAMTKYPDLNAIVGIASTTCPGVAQAVEAAEKIGKVITTGYCAPNTARQYIKSGAMPAETRLAGSVPM